MNYGRFVIISMSLTLLLLTSQASFASSPTNVPVTNTGIKTDDSKTAEVTPNTVEAVSPALIATPLNYGNSYSHHSTKFNTQRRFMVSLPERYYASDRRYPVLYIVDGDFQFQHVSAAVTNLARMGKIPPMIVVGIGIQGPTDYLKSTTWPSELEGDEFGGADTLQQYLTFELVPLIDKQYRTSVKRALAGYSLGGLFTLHSMLSDKTPFNAFLALSPSAWYDNYGINQKFTDYLTATKTLYPLYMSVANEQGMGVIELQQLMTKHAPLGWHVGFGHFPEETHYSTAMPAILAGLTHLAPDYYTDLDQLLEMKRYQTVFDHFSEKKKQWAGFRFEWLQAYNLAKYLFISKQNDQIDQVLIDAKQQFPESYLELSIGFAKAFIKKEQAQKALDILNSTQETGQHSADWQQQVSLCHQALGNIDLAAQHHQQALTLAAEHKLSSWEVWELQP